MKKQVVLEMEQPEISEIRDMLNEKAKYYEEHEGDEERKYLAEIFSESFDDIAKQLEKYLL